MGATDFYTVAHGSTSDEAFKSAREKALHEHGHGGYTGTIAEKSSFVSLVLPEGVEAGDYASLLIGKNDRRVCDKWGPAGCFRIEEGKYLFFGIAAE